MEKIKTKKPSNTSIAIARKSTMGIILHRLLDGSSATKAQLAKVTGLNPTSVNTIVQRLNVKLAESGWTIVAHTAGGEWQYTLSSNKAKEDAQALWTRVIGSAAPKGKTNKPSKPKRST